MTTDPLSDVLRAVRMQGAVFVDVRVTAPWCIASELGPGDCALHLLNPTQIVSFHMVTAGRLQVSIDGEPPMQVESGEIIMLPRNDYHVLWNGKPVTPVRGGALVEPSPEGGLARIRHGGGGEETRIICGYLACEDGFNPLIESLPPMIKLDVRAAASRGLFEASMEFAANELVEGRVAGSGVMSRLAELLFVEAVRNYAVASGENAVSWLKGVCDPQIGPALSAMHRDIATDWTVEGLARLAAMSRSAFVQKFTAVMGVAPIRYLTAWRLAISRRALRETAKTIGNVSFEVGYESESAFSRAFKREYGQSPAQWRDGELRAA